MEIKFYPKETQVNGNFNNGFILEKKPIGFPNENGKLKPFSNIFTGACMDTWRKKYYWSSSSPRL